jgi:hypothetical protein
MSRIWLAHFCALPFFCSVLRAQTDTTLREYFPMHVGDMWEYELDEYPYPHEQMIITNDTTMPNGYSYFNFDFDGSFGGFFRIDDSAVYNLFRDSSALRGKLDYDLSREDLCIWETLLSWTPCDSSQHFIGILWSQQDVYYQRLQVSADTKMFCEAEVDSTIMDTIFCPLVPKTPFTPRRLAKGLGIVWFQFEGPPLNLVDYNNGVQYGRTGW